MPELALIALDGTSKVEPWAETATLVVLGHSDCGTTRLALPVLELIHRAGGAVLVILQDPVEAARTLLDELASTLPARVEPPPYRVADALRLTTVPTLLLVGRGGHIESLSEGFRLADVETFARAVGVDPEALTSAGPLPALRPG